MSSASAALPSDTIVHLWALIRESLNGRVQRTTRTDRPGPFPPSTVGLRLSPPPSTPYENLIAALDKRLSEDKRTRLLEISRKFVDRLWNPFLDGKSEEALYDGWQGWKAEYGSFLREFAAVVEPVCDERIAEDAMAIDEEQGKRLEARASGDVADGFLLAWSILNDALAALQRHYDRAGSEGTGEDASGQRLGQAFLGFFLAFWLAMLCIESSDSVSIPPACLPFSVRKMRREASVFASEARQLIGHEARPSR